MSHLVFTETVNECQFIFYVHSFLMPQKLRGTITYMIKVGGVITVNVFSCGIGLNWTSNDIAPN